jgi:hypothetical protein
MQDISYTNSKKHVRHQIHVLIQQELLINCTENGYHSLLIYFDHISILIYPDF